MTTDTMTHDLLAEDLITPAAGIAEITGRRPAPTTVWRWITRGLQGHRLESVMVLGRRMTSRQAIRRWLAAVESARASQADAGPGESADRSESTSRRLADAGLI